MEPLRQQVEFMKVRPTKWEALLKSTRLQYDSQITIVTRIKHERDPSVPIFESRTITGHYGRLTIQNDGKYSYDVLSFDWGYSAEPTPYVDKFSYRLGSANWVDFWFYVRPA